MVTGPSVGPFMVLLLLMRWPILVLLAAIGGSGVYVYYKVDMHQVRDKIYELADDLNIELPRVAAHDHTHEHRAEIGFPAAVAAPSRKASGVVGGVN